MSLDALVDLIHAKEHSNWTGANEKAFQALFGGPDGRYPTRAERTMTLRAPEMSSESGVQFAAYFHPSNPKSGPYAGFSFVIFPVPESPCLVGLGIGTQGLSPDEGILGRPGHGRKAQAICAWLNRAFGAGEQVAWAKQDPTRTDITVPDNLQKKWPEFKPVFERYGKEMYALFRPTENRKSTAAAVTAFLDLAFEERGVQPNANHKADRDRIQSSWFGFLMPNINRNTVKQLLNERRFVIIQGPPGTGKTRMATELLRHEYSNFGQSIQFHPNTTYETFLGGLAPVQSEREVGLQFVPKSGFLMDAATTARNNSQKQYLLHIDEINRADLSKVLGESIFLLEPKADGQRVISLPYDFGDPFHDTFSLPENLHILGTMNSADRSIAIVDVAIRRRFAFVSLWPQMEVVEKNACEFMQNAFRELVSVFVEHATDDAFNLVPGHSYFLERDENQATATLKTGLAPLLEEYLAQGYIGGFAEPIRAYLQWVRSL